MLIAGIAIFIVALLLAIFASFIRPKLASKYDGNYTYHDIPYHRHYREEKVDQTPLETIEDRTELSEAYNTLGVRPDDPTALVKEIYRRKSMYFHPDKGGNPEKFKRLTEAFNIIMKSRDAGQPDQVRR